VKGGRHQPAPFAFEEEVCQNKKRLHGAPVLTVDASYWLRTSGMAALQDTHVTVDAPHANRRASIICVHIIEPSRLVLEDCAGPSQSMAGLYWQLVSRLIEIS
jgi:hypothetical protein